MIVPILLCFGKVSFSGAMSLLNFCVYVNIYVYINLLFGPTVDGRNPANQLVDSLSRYLQGFRHSRWFSRRISEPSTEFLAGCVPHVSRASSCALPTFINGRVALILLVIQNIREPHMVDFQVGGAYVRLKVDFESLGRDSSKARCFPGLFWGTI